MVLSRSRGIETNLFEKLGDYVVFCHLFFGH